MKRITMFRPYSAAAPRINGSPNTLPMVNLRPKKYMSPKAHIKPRPSGRSASAVSRTRRSVRAVTIVTRTIA